MISNLSLQLCVMRRTILDVPDYRFVSENDSIMALIFAFTYKNIMFTFLMIPASSYLEVSGNLFLHEMLSVQFLHHFNAITGFSKIENTLTIHFIRNMHTHAYSCSYPVNHVAAAECIKSYKYWSKVSGTVIFTFHFKPQIGGQ